MMMAERATQAFVFSTPSWWGRDNNSYLLQAFLKFAVRDGMLDPTSRETFIYQGLAELTSKFHAGLISCGWART